MMNDIEELMRVISEESSEEVIEASIMKLVSFNFLSSG